MDITLDHVLDEGILARAYTWLCKRRRNYPDHADVWNFRRHWRREMNRLRRELLEGSYRLGLLSRTKLENGEEASANGRIARIEQYYLTGGVIIIWARWVPGFIIHGPPGDVGLVGRPVVSWVAQGI